MCVGVVQLLTRVRPFLTYRLQNRIMAVDPAFKGVGKKEGLEIFRIEV